MTEGNTRFSYVGPCSDFDFLFFREKIFAIKNSAGSRKPAEEFYLRILGIDEARCNARLSYEISRWQCAVCKKLQRGRDGDAIDGVRLFDAKAYDGFDAPDQTARCVEFEVPFAVTT